MYILYLVYSHFFGVCLITILGGNAVKLQTWWIASPSIRIPPHLNHLSHFSFHAISSEAISSATWSPDHFASLSFHFWPSTMSCLKCPQQALTGLNTDVLFVAASSNKTDWATGLRYCFLAVQPSNHHMFTYGRGSCSRPLFLWSTEGQLVL